MGNEMEHEIVSTYYIIFRLYGSKKDPFITLRDFDQQPIVNKILIKSLRNA